jgi:hypothetical protein
MPARRAARLTRAVPSARACGRRGFGA